MITSITKTKLKETSKSLRSSSPFFFCDTILYFSESSRRTTKNTPNHRPVNTNEGSPILLILSRNAKALCTHAAIKINQATSARAPTLIFQGQTTEQLCRCRWEPRERITIVEDAVAGTDIVRSILLAASMRKNPKSI